MLCSLILHVAAMHFGTAQHYRTMVPGAGVECEVVDSISIAAGGYKNTDGDRSAYLVGAKDWKLTKDLQVGFFTGAINGYQWRNKGDWDYFGGLEAKWNFTDQVAFRAQIIPRPDPNTKAVIGIGFSYSFNLGE